MLHRFQSLPHIYDDIDQCLEIIGNRKDDNVDPILVAREIEDSKRQERLSSMRSHWGQLCNNQGLFPSPQGATDLPHAGVCLTHLRLIPPPTMLHCCSAPPASVTQEPMNFSNEKRYVKLLQQVQTLTMLQDSAHILGFALPDATSRKVLNLASHQIKVERAQRSLHRIEKEVLKLNTRWQPGDESYDQAAVLVAQDRAADLKMDIQRCASWFAAICSSHPLPHHYRLFQSHLRFAKQGKNYDASASKPKISHASASSRRSKAADRKAVLKQHHVTSACCTRAHLSPCV